MRRRETMSPAIGLMRFGVASSDGIGLGEVAENGRIVFCQACRLLQFRHGFRDPPGLQQGQPQQIPGARMDGCKPYCGPPVRKRHCPIALVEGGLSTV